MPTIKGIAWDHPRGFDPMIATAKEYTKTNPDVNIIWEKRPLQAFADRPIEEMAFEYDLMVIDHPHVGEASRKGLLTAFEMHNHKHLDGHKVSVELLNRGVYAKETHHSTVRVTPALTIEAWQIDDLAEAIRDVISAL